MYIGIFSPPLEYIISICINSIQPVIPRLWVLSGRVGLCGAGDARGSPILKFHFGIEVNKLDGLEKTRANAA